MCIWKSFQNKLHSIDWIVEVTSLLAFLTLQTLELRSATNVTQSEHLPDSQIKRSELSVKPFWNDSLNCHFFVWFQMTRDACCFCSRDGWPLTLGSPILAQKMSTGLCTRIHCQFVSMTPRGLNWLLWNQPFKGERGPKPLRPSSVKVASWTSTFFLLGLRICF